MSVTRLQNLRRQQFHHTTTNGASPLAFIYGFDNAVNGITGTDISIYGNSNTATNLVSNTGSYGVANDNTISGSQITINNVGLGGIWAAWETRFRIA